MAVLGAHAGGDRRRLEVGRNFYGIHMKFDQRIAG